MGALYITADKPGPTGGGQVVAHELAALRQAFGEAALLEFERPAPYWLVDMPLLDDYFAYNKLASSLALSSAWPLHFHFYSGSFPQSVGYALSRQQCVTYTCPAHDRRASISEFQKWGYAYPYVHLLDDGLWNLALQGLKQASKVIVPSTHSRDFLLREGLQPEKLIIIPHGCEPPTAPPSPLPQEFTVGYLGATGPDKGLPYLLESWGKLGYTGATLVLAGAGTETLAPLIRKLAPKGHFKLLGYVQDKAAFYNSLSLYVQPSVTESFSIEVLEAMSYGRPVVVSAGAGASDLVRGSMAGDVVQSGSAEALAEAINDFFIDTAKLAVRGQIAAKIAEGFTWEEVEQRYVSLFEEIQ